MDYKWTHLEYHGCAYNAAQDPVKIKVKDRISGCISFEKGWECKEYMRGVQI